MENLKFSISQGKISMKAVFILLGVLVLAGTLGFTVFKLTSKGPIAPTAPLSKPSAGSAACTYNFVVETPPAGATATPTPVSVACGSACSASENLWEGNPLPTSDIDAFDQYIQPNGKLRSNVFKGGRGWGYECSFGESGTVRACRAVSSFDLTTWAGSITRDESLWPNPLVTSDIDAFAQYMQPDGVLRSNVYKTSGGMTTYWGYECLFNPEGNMIGCGSKIQRSMVDASSDIQDQAAWAGHSFPTSVDGFSVYYNATKSKAWGTLTKGDRMWSYYCNADGSGCHAVRTKTLTEIAAEVGDTGNKWADNPLPATTIDDVGQYVQPDGLLRTNIFKGDRLWGYTCALDADGNPTGCQAVSTLDLGTWAGNIVLTTSDCAIGNVCSGGVCKIPECVGQSCTCTPPAGSTSTPTPPAATNTPVPGGPTNTPAPAGPTNTPAASGPTNTPRPAGPTNTPAPGTSTATPTPPQLPVSGSVTTTLGVILGGILLIGLAVVFAL